MMLTRPVNTKEDGKILPLTNRHSAQVPSVAAGSVDEDDEVPLSDLTRQDRHKSHQVPLTHRQSLQRRRSTATTASAGANRPASAVLPNVRHSATSSHKPTTPSANHPRPERAPTTTSANGTSSQSNRYKRKIGPYTLTKTLGAGSMGKVKLGIHETTGHKVAVKIIPRKVKVPENSTADEDTALTDMAHEDKRVMREVSILFLLNHPYVVKMEDFMVTPHHYYLMFENVEGGQLLDYIISHGKLNERTARKFSRQILSSLDLKIENILISNTGTIKIIDFGLSNLYSSKSHLSTFCGSLYFAAPELLCARAYTGPEVDIWSFGIVLYVLMCGEVPFDDKSMTVIHHKIKKGVVKYPPFLSPECKHLLSRLLVTNPTERATMEEILNHPWINKGFHGPPDSYFPIRQPLDPIADPEVIKRMTGFQFGTPEVIQQQVERSIAEVNRSHNSTPSPKFPHKGSRDVQTPVSYPHLSIYHLAKEKLEREQKLKERPNSANELGLALPQEVVPQRPQSATIPDNLNGANANLNRSRSCRPTAGVSGRYPSIGSNRLPQRKTSEAALGRSSESSNNHSNSLIRRKSDLRDSVGPLRDSTSLSRQISVKSEAAPHATSMRRSTSTNANSQPKRNSVPLASTVRPNEPTILEQPSTQQESLLLEQENKEQLSNSNITNNSSSKAPRRKPSRLERIGHMLIRGTSLRDHKAPHSPSNPPAEEPQPPSPRLLTNSIKPVFIKGLFSVASTSTKKPLVIRQEILRVLDEMGLSWREAEGYISVSQEAPQTNTDVANHGSQHGGSNLSSPGGSPPRQAKANPISSGSDNGGSDGEVNNEMSYNPQQELTPALSIIAPTITTPSITSSFKRSKSLKQRFSLRRSMSSKTSHSNSQPPPTPLSYQQGLLDPNSPSPTVAPLASGVGDPNYSSSLPPVRFEIQIVKLSLFRLHGIKFGRLVGHPWVYKDLCSQILKRAKL